jgi:hypothetical protein
MHHPIRTRCHKFSYPLKGNHDHVAYRALDRVLSATEQKVLHFHRLVIQATDLVQGEIK